MEKMALKTSRSKTPVGHDDLGGFEGVIHGKFDVQIKDPTSIGGIHRPHDGSCPIVQVLRQWASAALVGGITLHLFQFLHDTSQRHASLGPEHEVRVAKLDCLPFEPRTAQITNGRNTFACPLQTQISSVQALVNITPNVTIILVRSSSN